MKDGLNHQKFSSLWDIYSLCMAKRNPPIGRFQGTHMRFVDLQILRLLWSRMLENSVGFFLAAMGWGAKS